MQDTHLDDDDANHRRQQQPNAFLVINNTPVHFSEDWNTGIGGGLWSTGLAFAQYLQHRSEDVLDNLRRLATVKKHSSSSIWYDSNRLDNSDTTDDIGNHNGISALELGSGNGFLSACLLALVISHGNNNTNNIPLAELVITDMKDHLPLIFKTMKANSHVWDTLTYDDGESNVMLCDHESLVSSDTNVQPSADSTKQRRHTQQSPHVILVEHKWGELDSTNSNTHNNKQYDFIFGTDLAYRNSLHGPLISSLLHFSHKHTLCLIGVTMTDTQPIFFDRLTEAGFRYEKLADHLLQREFRGGNFGLIAIQRR